VRLAESPGLGGERLGIEVGQRECRTFPCEGLRDGEADAARRARDDDDLSREAADVRRRRWGGHGPEILGIGTRRRRRGYPDLVRMRTVTQ